MASFEIDNKQTFKLKELAGFSDKSITITLARHHAA
jgi:hypothetical protein